MFQRVFWSIKAIQKKLRLGLSLYCPRFQKLKTTISDVIMPFPAVLAG